MGYKGTNWSKRQYLRRKKRAIELGCSIYDIPDMRGKHKNHVNGSKHYKWNHAKIISSEGYVKIRVGVEHPLADSNGYAYEHLIVWCSTGQPKPNNNEIIHHKNEDKQDNRIDNLVLLNRTEHNLIHNLEKQRDEKGRFKKAAGRLLDGREWNEMPEVSHEQDA